MDTLRMTRVHLPDLYKVASATSHAGQRSVVRLTTMLLIAGLGSALFALAGGQDGPSWHSVADIATALLFAVAAVGGAWVGGGQAQLQWYDGRAAAESIKTLSWKYAMRSAPFEDDATADERFLGRLREILTAMRHLLLIDAASPAGQAMISDTMRRLRQAPLAIRRDAYHVSRILEQIEWYTRKAALAEKRARQWRVVTIVLGTSGVIGAMVRAFEVLDLDMLGLAAAGLASIAAWTQLRQYWPNAAAYRLTLIELHVISAESHGVEENDEAWARFCERAETAISREHIMWRARAR